MNVQNNSRMTHRRIKYDLNLRPGSDVQAGPTRVEHDEASKVLTAEERHDLTPRSGCYYSVGPGFSPRIAAPRENSSPGSSW